MHAYIHTYNNKIKSSLKILTTTEIKKDGELKEFKQTFATR